MYQIAIVEISMILVAQKSFDCLSVDISDYDKNDKLGT